MSDRLLPDASVEAEPRSVPFDDASACRRQAWSLVHSLEQRFKAIEVLRPERAVQAHPVEQWRQSLWLSTAVRLASIAPAAHQAGALEGTQMLGHCRLGDTRAIGQRVHGLLPLAAQSLEDAAPCGVSQGPENEIRCGRYL